MTSCSSRLRFGYTNSGCFSIRNITDVICTCKQHLQMNTLKFLCNWYSCLALL